MYITNLSRRGITGLLIAATFFSTAGIAQSAMRPAPEKSIKPGKPDIVVNCCRCIGEKSAPLDISTGKANWTVSKTHTAPPPMPAGGWSVGPIAAVPTNLSPQVLPGNIGPNPLPGTWTNLLGADWLQPAANIAGTAWNSTVPNGHWTYVLKVEVPKCTIPQKVVINGKLAADDYGRMYVDGPGGWTSTLVGPTGAGFAVSATQSFNAVLNPSMGGFTQPGIYYIRVELDNLGGAPAGIVLKGTIAGECSDKLTRNEQKDGKRDDCPDC